MIRYGFRRGAVLLWLAAVTLVGGVTFADETENEILLELQPGVGIEVIEQRYNVTALGSVDDLLVWVVQVPAGVDRDDVINDMIGDNDIRAVERHRELETPESVQRSVPDLGLVADINDYFGQPAGVTIKVFGVPDTLIGTGQTVAVLDTGVDLSNPMFDAILQKPGYDFAQGNGTADSQPNALDDDADGMIDEALHHGTSVVGLIHLGAPGAKVVPIRILDEDGIGTTFAVARGIVAAARSGAKVINLSIQMIEDSAVVEDAIEDAVDLGVVVVAAVGNDGISTVAFPAVHPEVIAVAAVDENLQRASFSNYGSQVDVSAPGTTLISPYAEQFAGWDGTSFAAPLVAAGVAILRQRYPGLTPAEVKAVVRATAQPDNVIPAEQGLMGTGVVDLEALATVLTTDRTSIKIGPDNSEGHTLRWTPVLGATAYDVIRGDLANLSAINLGTADLGPVTCVAEDTPTPGIDDAATPEPGQGFFYLFRDDGTDLRGGSYGTRWDDIYKERVAGAGDCQPNSAQ